MAQTAPAGTPEQAQTTPAIPPSPEGDDPVQATNDAAGGEEIVVTGLRRSLESSQAIKRDSLQIVDAIVAEDIGKLPDRTVSEALTRIPGVTVERRVAEAGDVFIRGLREPATTYNGRDIFTAEARNVAPQDFPAGGVAALEVYKATTAEQVEGNLAGLINVRSRRPFDFRGLEIAGALNGTYSDRADDIGWNGNLLVSNRWETGMGDVGALVNVSYTELEYFDAARFVSGDFFGIDPVAGQANTFRDNLGVNGAQTVRSPVGVGLFQSPGRRTRPSVNASLQWRPTDELEFYVDGLYQGFRREVSDRSLFVPIFGGGATYTNVAIRPEGGFVESLTAAGQARPDGFQAATKEKTDTYQFAVGGIYDTDRFRVVVDLARTDSQFDQSIYSVDYALNAAPPLSVVFDVPRGDGGVEFDLGGFDTTNLDNYVYRGFFDRHLTAKGDDYQARLDTEVKDLAEWLPRVQFGVRFSDRDGGFGSGERYQPVPTAGPGAVPYGSLPLEFAVTRDAYRGNIQPVRQLILPTYDSIRGSISELRTIAGFGQGRPPFDPRLTYEANEKTYTGYAQINYEFDTGSVPIDGAVGLRAVRTEFDLSGSVVDVTPGQPDRIVPLEIGNSYTDYLPNASIRARLTDQLQLRASYTQTRTRPPFGDLNPGLTIDPPGGSPIRSARGGNPNLQPVESDNYDLSLEYYFSRSGFASLALFRRDVSGFVLDFEQQVDIPGFGPVNVRGPVNSGDGRLQGIEAQFRTFFDFDFVPQWAQGFGTELNFTYIDDELEGPDDADVSFPNVSKYSYNIVGFYELGPLTARVAYNSRSNYTERFFSGVGEYVEDVARLDASVSYALSENLTVSADVSNILADPFRNFRGIEDGVVYPRDVRYEERVYSIGIRARL
jgi:TonB-dependent receptor